MDRIPTRVHCLQHQQPLIPVTDDTVAELIVILLASVQLLSLTGKRDYLKEVLDYLADRTFTGLTL